MGKIVVGVDASPGAQRALAWAADEALQQRAEFSRLVLGSVSHAAVVHARCPVVVIPAGAEERKAAAPARVAGPEARP